MSEPYGAFKNMLIFHDVIGYPKMVIFGENVLVQALEWSQICPAWI